jgi:hypothetical protein
MKKILFSIFALIFVISCGPSVNPQLRARIDGYSHGSPASKYAGVRKFMEPMPYAPGQYVVFLTTDKKGVKSISKISIIGKQSGGWIFENYSLTESQESVSQMLITGLDKAKNSKNPDDIDILWVKIRDKKGQITTIDGPVLSFTKSLYKGMMPKVNQDFSVSKDGGAVRVPAGSFSGTLKVHTEQKIMGSNVVTDSWVHPAVPINGLVKSVSEDGDYTMELVKFGIKGAVSELK